MNYIFCIWLCWRNTLLKNIILCCCFLSFFAQFAQS